MRNAGHWVAVAVLSACGTGEVERTTTTSPSARSCKPEAPVSITLTARPLAGDRYEIAMAATPTAAVDSLELVLVADDGTFVTTPRATRGATAAGASHSLVATMIAGPRTSVHAIARVPVEGITMSRSSTLALYVEPAPVTRSYVLPDGERAKELRP